MKQILSLLGFLLCASCCDDCRNVDYLRFRLRTADDKDFLVENHLKASDVSLFTIQKRDTLLADAWPDYRQETDSSLLAFEVSHLFSKVYISVNGEIKDSLTLSLKITDTNCCPNMTRIQSVEYHNKNQAYGIFDVIDVVVE
jgi:hypothetical protein